MNISHPVARYVDNVKFTFYSPKELLNLSVVEISNPQMFDTLNNPTQCSLYDSRLGPHIKNAVCSTCFLDFHSCPGHFGHIQLVVPTYNPITFMKMFKLLRSSCFYCHSLCASSSAVKVFYWKFQLIRAGHVEKAASLDTYFDEKECMILLSKKQKVKTIVIQEAFKKTERQFWNSMTVSRCKSCKGISNVLRNDGLVKIFQKPLAKKSMDIMNALGKSYSSATDEMFFDPIQAKQQLTRLFEQEPILSLLFTSGVQSFFIEILPVTPSKFRPVSKMGDMMFENPQNIYLVEILKSNILIKDSRLIEKTYLETNQDAPKIEIEKQLQILGKKKLEAWVKLQESVNNLIDSSKVPVPQGKVAPPGIRQLLEKKEGLFRKHMMGKRVNYACRSVISPDPYIETNEIGIPPVFAKKLTYPEPVTPHNFNEMRAAVINGPAEWPGATHIQNEDGTLVSLAAFDAPGREALANQLMTPQHNTSVNKKVYRHLRNGDFLLLNRQPTLHKPSIMAHTARVLPGERTIRMHYANCNTYNADFDGDEMNAHFPQNEIARAEAMLIARTDQQYLVPTDGGVLRGLIQDHVDAGVDMCNKDTFLTRDLYVQLVYQGLRENSSSASVGNGNIEKAVEIGENGRILTQPPAIWKPVPLWTGKQVISTILENLVPTGRNSLNMISKSKIPHKSWGESGKEEQTVMIMDGELVTGILDKSQFGSSANGLVHSVYEVYGAVYAGKLLSILGRLFTAYLQNVGFSCRMDDLRLTKKGDKIRRKLIDSAQEIDQVTIDYVKEVTKKGLREGYEIVLRDTEKVAGLDSAMKSSTNKTTSLIISSCVPENLFKPFPQNNMQVMTVSGAKGSSVNVSQISCLLGQQELEGKRVPMMISGKSLPSFRSYDPSARAGGYITGRFLTGIKPQEYYFHCMAGREGLIDTAVKTSRSGYLQRCLIKHLEGIRVHYDHTVRDSDGSILQFLYGEDSLDVCKQTTLEKFEFNALNYRALLARYGPTEMMEKIDDSTVKKYLKKGGSNALEKFAPSRYIGAVSDSFAENLRKYIEENPGGLLKEKGLSASRWSGELIRPKMFKGLMELKYMHSLVEPGECVGLLAAQSIGEPSTQMTLNTFHFAGFGAKNVTLGIPRLREIIMTASANINTPLMKLPLKPGVTDKQQINLCEEISKLVFAQIVTGVQVTEKFVPKTAHSDRVKELTIRVQFWNKSDYEEQYGISKTQLGLIIEQQFIPLLERTITKDLKGRVRKGVNIPDIGKGNKKAAEKSENNDENEVIQKSAKEELSDEEISDVEEGDGDFTSSKEKGKKKQHATYDDDENNSEADDVEEDPMPIAEDEIEQSDDKIAEKEENDRVVEGGKYVSNYKFDKNGEYCEISMQFSADTKKILMVSLVENVAKAVVIHQVPGIERCFPQPNESENDKSINLGTEGCNLKGMWDFADQIDLDNIYTNDISAILHTYGVEAARTAIIQEIASVFGVYGIDVDTRHLSLIADYMTFEGGYKAFNRMGIDSNPSPFTQMSFERTSHFLTNATLCGDNDDLKSPSARIVMGQVVKGGTGAFDVLQLIQ